MASDSGQALVGLGIMCLSTNLLNAISSVLPDRMDEVGRYVLLFMASLILSFPWVLALNTWIDCTRRISETACNNSLVGGLIAANVGLAHITFAQGRSTLKFQSKLSYVAWPAYLGMLLGFWWAWREWYWLRASSRFDFGMKELNRLLCQSQAKRNEPFPRHILFLASIVIQSFT